MNDILIGRLEIAASILRLAAMEAKDRGLLGSASRITDLRVEVDTLIVLANPTLRCDRDRATCAGCVDCFCLN